MTLTAETYTPTARDFASWGLVPARCAFCSHVQWVNKFDMHRKADRPRCEACAATHLELCSELAKYGDAGAKRAERLRIAADKAAS